MRAWSRREDSNLQPPVYKTGALPLSYFGGADGKFRACDILGFNQALYHLSYIGGGRQTTRTPTVGSPRSICFQDSGQSIPALPSKLVRSTGLEPVRPFGHPLLRRTCLPFQSRTLLKEVFGRCFPLLTNILTALIHYPNNNCRLLSAKLLEFSCSEETL